MLGGVVEAVEMSDLPQSCKAMLVAAIPKSLGVPSDERQKPQQQVIECLGEVIEAVRVQLEAKHNHEQVQASGANASHQQVKDACETTKIHLAERETAVGGLQKGLADCSTVVAESQAAVATAEAALKQVEQKKEFDEKAVLEATLADDFASSRTGGAAAVKKTKGIAERLSLDKSALTALPGALGKEPGDRTEFDKMVLIEVKKAFEVRIAGIDAVLTDGAAERTSRQASLEAAHAQLSLARESRDAAAEALAAGKRSVEEAKVAAKTAEASAEAGAPAFVEATRLRDECREKLQNFEDYNVSCFTMLKEQVSKRAQAETQAQVAGKATAEGVLEGTDAVENTLNEAPN